MTQVYRRESNMSIAMCRKGPTLCEHDECILLRLPKAREPRQDECEGRDPHASLGILLRPMERKTWRAILLVRTDRPRPQRI